MFGYILFRRCKRFNARTRILYKLNAGVTLIFLIILLMYRWGPANFNDFANDGQMRDRNEANIWNTPVQLDWQNVSGLQDVDVFLVYSAYHIHSQQEIRVIGATRTESNELVICLLCEHPLQQCIEVIGTIKTMRENWDLLYSPCFVLCPVPTHVRVKTFEYVTVLPNSRRTVDHDEDNVIPIQFPADKARNSVEFAVCVPPVHRDYDNVLQFLEWIEFHRIMGVEHFSFYNVSIGPRVSCLMNEIYGNIATVLPWTHPFESEKNIRGELLFGALNDCAYRHRGAAEYLIIVDFDEMIVPTTAQNYSKLMNQLNEFDNDTNSLNEPLGAYLAQNAFFYLQYPDHKVDVSFTGDHFVRSVGRQLLLLRKTRRLASLYPHGTRSKYICIPEHVMEVGNHFIWEYANGYNGQLSPPELMISHHYRLDDFGGEESYDRPSIVHNRASFPFERSLILNVATKLKEFEEKCGVDISHWM